ncbi:MAG: HAD-IIIA family hydrolase [Arachidicoccus sp.]|nr:HAD-IIIA family hydrolase [Arachidicoccus sp.]
MIYNKNWTLFLDRDGVLNEDNPGDYVKDLDKYRIMPGVKEAMKKLSGIFGTIVVCTNQRGVSKGVFTIETMHAMNNILLKEIKNSGGRIDKIYYAIDLEDNAPNRKPNPGMALQAKQDFPQIDFSKSIMVGNNISDMQFARNAGINTTIFLTTTNDVTLPHPLIDAKFDSLKSFADNIDLL